MKKLIAYLVICALLILPANSLLASANTVSFFEALSNVATIEDYKLVQSFYGNAEFDESGDHVSAKYRISVSSVVDGGNRIDNFNRLSAYVKFINHNEVTDSTPFKEMTIQANGEIITRNQQDIYFKINNFHIGLTQPLPFAVIDIENAMAMADLYRGTWFHTSPTELAMDKFDEEVIDVEEYIALEEQLKEDPKEAILELAELILADTDSGFSEEEMKDFLEGVSLTLETKLFTEREVVAGRNTGFRFFNLNKGAIVNLMREAAQILYESMNKDDESVIRAGLSKVSMSGIYRVEDVHNLIDNLLIRFRLRDIGPVLNLELNYRYKLSDINKENSVKAPTTYEEWYGLGGAFDDEIFYEDEWFDEEFPEEDF
ncbi:MAG TPA: hypothetical protein ENK70_02435 [Methylophaga sp.]|nr:hypothetical protein [Methylophaga sp.]